MSSDAPPTYYFNNINYNGLFYGTNQTGGISAGGISVSYSNSHYLASNSWAIATSLASSTSLAIK